jgi:hypothetical protein
VVERTFLQAGRLVRPLARSARVRSRGYSLPLQRRMTDFGADVAFGRVPAKLEEHYGITVPVSAVRSVTERHARAMRDGATLQRERSQAAGEPQLIAELDGSMIPVVDTVAPQDATPGQDRRKTRTLRWQEARLALVHAPGSASPVFGATLDGPEAVGEQLLHCAIRAGLGRATQVHGLGDGAPWIAEQMERVFGAQGRYLLDFYHVGEYLAAAAKGGAATNPKAWVDCQQQRLKAGQVQDVLAALQPHLEPEIVPSAEAPSRACDRSLRNRLDQLDYSGALASDLPIGSGEIESAHRYVIQARLKLAGAWWTEDTAHDMLTLRVCRANHDWESYGSTRTRHTAGEPTQDF